MIITVQPSDLIKRCIWTEYKRFCLKTKNEDEIKEIIVNDSPVIICEDDAFVIGLLKIIETDNLVHRFNQHLDDFLRVKSNIFNGKLYIVKSILLKELISFKERFPEEFKPSFDFKIGIENLYSHIDNIIQKTEELKVEIVTYNDKKFNCVLTNSVKCFIS